jgi:hypothetical protein
MQELHVLIARSGFTALRRFRAGWWRISRSPNTRTTIRASAVRTRFAAAAESPAAAQSVGIDRDNTVPISEVVEVRESRHFGAVLVEAM